MAFLFMVTVDSVWLYMVHFVLIFFVYPCKYVVNLIKSFFFNLANGAIVLLHNRLDRVCARNWIFSFFQSASSSSDAHTLWPKVNKRKTRGQVLCKSLYKQKNVFCSKEDANDCFHLKLHTKSVEQILSYCARLWIKKLLQISALLGCYLKDLYFDKFSIPSSFDSNCVLICHTVSSALKQCPPVVDRCNFLSDQFYTFTTHILYIYVLNYCSSSKTAGKK